MKTLHLCALLLALPGAALASDARPAKPDMDLNIPPYQLNTQIFDFPTGLRIMMQADASHPVVTTWMVVNNGSKDDLPGKEETAHFVEHTWFRSKHGTLPPIMDLIQDIGTRFNATTRNDWTDYRTVASREYLPLMLRLESLRLTEPYAGVTEEEIDVEREVIRSEWRRRNEQNINQLFDFLYESVYPADHGYHDHSTHASIDNIKLADLQKFMDDHYKPENTTILVVGDIPTDPTEQASLIFANFAPQLLHPRLDKEDYFYSPKPGVTNPDQNNPEDWLVMAYDPDSPQDNRQLFEFSKRIEPRITDERPPVPPVGTTEVRTRQAPVDNRMVTIGWSLPGGFRSDEAELTMVANMANQYIWRGLYEELEDEKIGEFGCFVQPEVLNSTMMCVAELLDDDLDQMDIRDKMVDQLPEIWNPENFAQLTPQSQVFQTSLTRAKMEGMADLLLSLDVFAQEFGGRAEIITPHVHYTNSATTHSDLMNSIMKIDPSRVSKIAYENLRRDRMATVFLEPLPEDQIDIGSEASTYRGASMNDQVIRSGDDLKTMTAEQIADSYVKPNLEGMLDFELANGMRVVIVKHGEAPLVRASLLLGRDSSREKPLENDFASSFIRSVGQDPLPIAAEAGYYVNPGLPGVAPGYAYPLAVDPDFDLYGNAIRLWLRAPSGNLDGALWILREEMETAKPYIDDKTGWVKSQEDEIQGEWKWRDWHLERASQEYLFPGAAWHQKTTWEEVQAAKEWGATESDAYAAQLLQPANATLLIVGNVDPEAAKKQVVTYFGGWVARPNAAKPPEKPITPAMPTGPSKILIYDDPKRTQTDLNLQCRLNVTNQNQEFAVGVLSSLLGTKVFSTMRVKEGLAYSPGAGGSISSDGSAALTFYSDGVVNSGVGRMMTFFDQALTEVEQGKVDVDEITLHKLRNARRSGVSAQSLDQVTDKLTSIVRTEEAWSALGERGDLIASVQPAELQDLVKGCKDHSITTMVGPKDVISPQLDELGLEYQIVEWRGDGEDLLWQHDPKQAKKNEKKRQKADKKKAKEDAKKKDETPTE
ncbi:MAG: insulinase family protein [Myxococcota bacterium]